MQSQSSSTKRIDIQRDLKDFFEVLNALPYGIMLIDKSRTIFFANSGCKDLLSNQNLRGKTCEKIFRCKSCSDSCAITNEQAEMRREQIFTNSGSQIPVLRSTQLINLNSVTYWLVVIIDNRDQISLEMKAIREARGFELLFDENSDGLIVHSYTGKIFKVNQKACNLLGYNNEELLELNMSDFKVNMMSKYIDSGLFTPSGSYEANFETEITRKNGCKFTAEIHSSAIDYQDIPLIISSVRDVSLRKKYEMSLIEAKRKAEESDRLKTCFLNNLSHELRTPLNGILGFSDLLPETDNFDEVRQYSGFINRCGKRLLAVIDDLIHSSTILANEVQVSKKICSINELFGLFEENLQEDLKDSEKKEVLDFKSCKPENLNGQTVYIDPNLFKIVVRNISRNAIKYTHQGSIELGVQIDDAKHPVFYIRDTGIGIGLEQQGKIYDFFRQGVEELNRPFEGMGTGLSIAKELIDRMGGNIWFESELGLGTTFYIQV